MQKVSLNMRGLFCTGRFQMMTSGSYVQTQRITESIMKYALRWEPLRYYSQPRIPSRAWLWSAAFLTLLLSITSAWSCCPLNRNLKSSILSSDLLCSIDSLPAPMATLWSGAGFYFIEHSIFPLSNSWRGAKHFRWRGEVKLF